ARAGDLRHGDRAGGAGGRDRLESAFRGELGKPGGRRLPRPARRAQGDAAGRPADGKNGQRSHVTMDAGSFTLISRLSAMGSGSFLQYVSQSFPWSADPAHAAVKSIREIAQEEHDEVRRFMRILQKKHLRLPPMGSYPSHFTTINFCSLDFL